jgi:hypothetical protein
MATFLVEAAQTLPAEIESVWYHIHQSAFTQAGEDHFVILL